MEKRFQRVAHRGGSRLAPENTLAAFREALTLPIDAVELDVQMSRDGQAIVLHNNTVERVTDGEGNILDLDFASLRKLNAAACFPGGWPEPQQIPTLHEVLDLVRGYCQVYIEIKESKRDGIYGHYPHIEEAVVNEVRALNMLDQVLVISFDWSVLPRIKELAPAVRTGALVETRVWNPHAERTLAALAEQAKTLGCSWINMDRTLSTNDMPAFFHQYDLQLGLWTVNTFDELRRFAAAGVDSLTTDRPDLFSEL
jgi:glycerophosphoryl diester phosphodiesterase